MNIINNINFDEFTENISKVKQKYHLSEDFQTLLEQAVADSRLAEQHYSPNPEFMFAVQDLSSEELLRVENDICDYITSSEYQFSGSVAAAVSDLQTCLGQHLTLNDSDNTFDYNKYVKKILRSRRNWQKALKKSILRVHRIIKGKLSCDFTNDELKALSGETDRLFALCFNRPDPSWEKLKAIMSHNM